MSCATWTYGAGESLMSARLRLTILYSGILAATLFIFGAVLYFYMAHTMVAEVDRTIGGKARKVVRSIRIVGGFPLPLQQVVLPDVDVFASPNTFLQAVDKEGKIVARSTNLGMQTLPVGEETLRQAAGRQSFFETIDSGGRQLRIYNVPLVWQDQVLGVLQVGQSLIPVAVALARLRLVLLGSSFLTVLLAGTLGWFLARTVLRPIERVADTVEAIQEARDLKRRVTYTGPRDEIGRLVSTINEMLSRLGTAYQKLAESHATQRRFVADASHELRTPLTTIRGNVELLKKMGDDQPQVRAEALDDIASEAERLSRLVTDLLTLARADAGVVMEKERVALAELLEEVSRQARLLVGKHRLEVIDFHELERATVHGNWSLLKQLLLILIDNAYKYTPEEGLISLKAIKRGKEVGMAVADTGIGIAEPDLPHIFERFYRADRARVGSGTGLGLSIARWIVEEHGGRIEVSSTPGKGSTFTVWFPMEQERVDSPASPETGT